MERIRLASATGGNDLAVHDGKTRSLSGGGRPVLSTGVPMVYSPLPASDTRPSDRLGVAITAGADELHVQVVGELDLASAPWLASCLGSLRSHTGPLCLDLTRVTFLDLSGLRVLLDARHDARARGDHLRVVAPAGACRRLIELTETEHLLERR